MNEIELINKLQATEAERDQLLELARSLDMLVEQRFRSGALYLEVRHKLEQIAADAIARRAKAQPAAYTEFIESARQVINSLVEKNYELGKQAEQAEKELNHTSYLFDLATEQRDRAAKRRDQLIMVLRGIHEMTTETIRLNGATSQACVWQVNEAAAAALTEREKK